MIIVRRVQLRVMYTILLPIDSGGDLSANVVEYLSKIPQSSESVAVTVLNVAEEFEVVDGGGTVRSEDLYDESMVPESVSRVAESLKREGIDVTVRREHGDPEKEILSVAGEIGADQIVIGGRKRTPIGKVLFGSVTQGVLLSADRPVTVVMDES